MVRRVFDHARRVAWAGAIVAGVTASGNAFADPAKSPPSAGVGAVASAKGTSTSPAAGTSSTSGASPTGTSGAGTSAAGTSAAGAPTAGTPAPGSPAITQADEEASTRFKRGLQLFDEGDYTLALVEFERAYQLAPNYRALYNIGLVDVQLGRYADASRTLHQYLHDGGDAIPPGRKAEVQKTLDELKLRTATVEIAANVSGAEISLDGKPLDSSMLRAPLLIDAGEHTLRATAPGYSPGYKTLTLAGADQISVHLNLIALPTAKGPVEAPQERGRTLFWPGFVATGALAAGAIVSGVITLDAHSRLNTQLNTVGSSASQRQSTANEVNGAALAADILTGLAVVTGGVSLYLSLRVDHTPKAGGQSASGGALGLTLSPQQLSLAGTF